MTINDWRDMLSGETVNEVGGSLPGALCGSHLGSLGMSVTAWRDGEQANVPGLWGWDWCKTVRDGAPSPEMLKNASLLIDSRPLDAQPLDGPTVVCRILGDWDTGIEEMPEVVVQSYIGLTAYVGSWTDGPMRVGAPVVTMATGVAAVQGSLAALHWARRVAGPCTVTVTAVGVGLALLGNNVTSESDPDARTGFAQAATADPGVGSRCADGVVDFMYHRDDGGFLAFCKWLGKPGLAIDERFSTMAARALHGRELAAQLRPSLATRPVEAVLGELQNTGAIFAKRELVPDLAKHPQVRALGLVTTLPWEGQDQAVVGLPFAINGLRPAATASREAG